MRAARGRRHYSCCSRRSPSRRPAIGEAVAAEEKLMVEEKVLRQGVACTWISSFRHCSSKCDLQVVSHCVAASMRSKLPDGALCSVQPAGSGGAGAEALDGARADMLRCLTGNKRREQRRRKLRSSVKVMMQAQAEKVVGLGVALRRQRACS